MTGQEGGEPIKAGSPVADINSGILAALGIAAAYVEQQRTGLGQVVDTSLFEAGLQQMYWPAANYFADGTVLRKMGSANSTSAPYQVFRSRDGWINIGAANQSNYERLLDVLAAPELAADPRFTTNADRLANREQLVELLNGHLAQRSTAEWTAAFDRVGLPAGPVLEIPDVLAHPQTLARGMIVETDHPLEGKTKGLGLPIRFSGLAERRSLPAPLLGEHTLEVLGEIGFSVSEICALVDQRAVFAAS